MDIIFRNFWKCAKAFRDFTQASSITPIQLTDFVCKFLEKFGAVAPNLGNENIFSLREQMRLDLGFKMRGSPALCDEQP